jgi:hypothetical protein
VAPAADVDRGLTGRPFAEKADGVLGEQVGDRLRGRALDFGPFDDLNRADHTAALPGGSRCARTRGWRICGDDVASADDLNRAGHTLARFRTSARRHDHLIQIDLRGCRRKPRRRRKERGAYIDRT